VVTLILVTLFTNSIDSFVIYGHGHIRSNSLGVALEEEGASMRRISFGLAGAKGKELRTRT
jgi:hypothetical protein